MYDRPIGHKLRLSGYAEAGVVGLSKHDMFIDGAVEIMHPIASRNTLRVEAGVAGWGAAQTSVARLDIGPEAALHAHIGGANIKLAASYRFEIMGNAAPSSGPALSLGTDF